MRRSSYIPPIPGQIKDGDDTRTDILELLGLTDLSPLDIGEYNDGRCTPPVATVVIEGKEYSLKQIIASLRAEASADAAGLMSAEDYALLHSSQIGFLELKRLIARGMGPSMFPVGSQIKVEHEVYGELIADVIGHDIKLDPAGRTPYSMTFMLHTLLESTEFDATEALYYAETGLVAGTYNFTLLAGYDVENGGGKTLQFTTTQNVPAGGVIMFPWARDAQSLGIKISTYESRSATAAIENNIPVTEGSGGTALTPTNHTQRIRYGSNNWQESAIRQWLNSTAAAGAWWTPQTNYDRPPPYTSRPGFLNGMPDDFLAVVGEVDNVTALNTVTDGGGSVTTRDRIFLPSRKEIFGFGENSIDEGAQFPFFAGLTNDQRKKYYASGNVGYWWLRSPLFDQAYNERLILTTGSLGNSSVSNRHGAAASWTIY